jgi:hypothetical protein
MKQEKITIISFGYEDEIICCLKGKLNKNQLLLWVNLWLKSKSKLAKKINSEFKKDSRNKIIFSESKSYSTISVEIEPLSSYHLTVQYETLYTLES